MKKNTLVPMPAKLIIACVCSVLGLAFILLFFLSPSPAEYRLVRSQEAKVMKVMATGSNQRFNRTSAAAVVEFENGVRGVMSFSTQFNIQKGQVISVDILEADGEKPRYRLSPQ